MAPLYVTETQGMQHTGRARRSFQRWVRDGDITYVRQPGCRERLYPLADLERLAAEKDQRRRAGLKAGR